ncbi:MAG: 4Fe-4S binding protein [Dehalococcoidia bacterium]
MRRILVALCYCAGLNGVDLEHIRRSLGGHFPGVVVRGPEALCQKPALLARIALECQAEGVVVGACAEKEHRMAFEREVQRVRLASLSLRTVDLKGWHRPVPDQEMALARATLLLAGAVARLQASPEVSPDAVRLRLASLSTPVSRRALFRLPPVRYQEVAVVKEDLCAAEQGCRLCLGACPYQALEEGDGAIRVVRERCEGCGLCAPSCPVQAINLPANGISPLRAEVHALLTFPQERLSQRVIAFTCPCGALPQGDDSPPPSIFQVEVPCLGMLPLEVLLLVFGLGGTGVALPDAAHCPHRASPVVRGRIQALADLLEALGLGRERLAILPSDKGAQADTLHRLATLPSLAPLETSREDGLPALLLALAQRASARVHQEHSFVPLGVVQVSTACTLCGTCATLCPPQALAIQESEGEVALTFNPARCTACALCVPACPERAISLWQGVDTTTLAQGPRVLARTEQAVCRSCGRPFMPLALVKRVESLMAQQGIANLHGFTGLCPDCRAFRPLPP